MNREFVCMEETVADTQKKIRTWVSSGYEIEIISQHLIQPSSTNSGLPVLVTCLWRTK